MPDHEPSSSHDACASATASSSTPATETVRLQLEVKKHIAFWLRHLRLLPRPYQSGDTQRMSLAFFCLSGLDLLGAVEEKLSEKERAEYREWIWAQQLPGGGFRGSPAAGDQAGPSSSARCGVEAGHLAMTYTALLNLAILRDDFSRLDRRALQVLLSSCQNHDGSFSPSPGHSEYDPRFTFCAFAICWMLDDWSSIDLDGALVFLQTCRSYDGAYGQGPNQESQGGSTYCVISSLSLAGNLDDALPPSGSERERAVEWLLKRQCNREDAPPMCDEADEEADEDDDDHPPPPGGFHGRVNKPSDSCYSFWIGASLSVLGWHDMMDAQANVIHLLSLQTPIGGIPKNQDAPPDVMHAYLALAALAIHAGGGESEGEAGSGDEWRDRCGLTRGFKHGLEPRLNVNRATVSWIEHHLRRTGQDLRERSSFLT